MKRYLAALALGALLAGCSSHPAGSGAGAAKGAGGTTGPATAAPW